MGFLDVLLGRTKPVQPKLDDLFALPSAAIQLQAATGFTPTGSGSVCFRSVEGKTFADIKKEVRGLLDLDDGEPGGGGLGRGDQGQLRVHLADQQPHE